MSWAVVARKDFEDAVRSKMLWAITVLFVVFTAGGMFAVDLAFDDMQAFDALMWLSAPASLIVPITALIAAYLSIAGERESGSIKLLLGLPHTRRDVLVGKLLGRTGVVAVATFVAFAAGAVVLLVQYGSLPVVAFSLLGLLTFFFALTFVGIAVGISAMTATRARAMASAIGVFFIFELLWDVVPTGVYYLVEGTVPNPAVQKLPAWYFFVQRLTPSNAYGAATTLAVNPDTARSLTVGAGGQTQASSQASNGLADFVVGGEIPFYLEDWFGLVVLAVWLVVPLALGYWNFRQADLS